MACGVQALKLCAVLRVKAKAVKGLGSGLRGLVVQGLGSRPLRI